MKFYPNHKSEIRIIYLEHFVLGPCCVQRMMTHLQKTPAPA